MQSMGGCIFYFAFIIKLLNFWDLFLPNRDHLRSMFDPNSVDFSILVYNLPI